jgi:DNA-binding transcriptional LysR family regulator
MDLRQLNALLAVADHGSFSAAARALHTVQSNVSTHIARLERELDATLIDRAHGTLTDEGQVVANRARRIQAELDALAADVASLHDELVGTVRIGVIGTTARWLVPGLVERMLERHPRVRVVVTDATTSSLVPMLATGRLDLAVVNLPTSDPDVETEHLFDEDRLLVAPEGHPLHERDHVALTELGDWPLLLEPEGTSFRDELDQECAAVGTVLQAQAEVDGMRLLATLAFGGFGATLLPATAAPLTLGGTWRRIPVDGLQGRAVGLAVRRRGLLSAPARALRQVVGQVVQDEGPQLPGVHPGTPLAEPGR